MTKGRQLSSLKGIDLSPKIRDEVRRHERRKLIYLGLDVIQFLVNFFLCWKRFCCWFDLGGYEFPPLFTEKGLLWFPWKWFPLNWLLLWLLDLFGPFLLSGVMEVINLLVVLSSCSALGKSSPNKNFPGLRVLEQACLNSWLRKGLIASLRLKESSLCIWPIKATESVSLGIRVL